MHQEYSSEILSEYVISGNNALMKCSIPSYVADFVHVSSWVSNTGEPFVPGQDYGKLYSFSRYQLYSFFSQKQR